MSQIHNNIKLNSTILIILLSFLVNFFIFSYLNNIFLNDFSNKGDLNYIAKGFIFSQQWNFYNAFNEGLREPLYPILISIIIKIFYPENLNIFQIINQIATSSIVLTSFAIYKKLKLSDFSSLFLSTITGLWYPFHYYNNLYVVEPIAIGLCFIFILFLLNHSFYKASIILSIMILFKSHFILLFFPLSVYIILFNKNFIDKILKIIFSLIIILLILAPYSIFLSKNYNTFIGTTIVGPNTIYHNLVYPPTYANKYFNLHTDHVSKDLEEKSEDYSNIGDRKNQITINNCIDLVSKDITQNKKFNYDNFFLEKLNNTNCSNKYASQTIFYMKEINKNLYHLILFDKKFLLKNFLAKSIDSIGLYFNNFKDFILFISFSLFLISIYISFFYQKDLFILGLAFITIHFIVSSIINGGFIYRVTLSEPYYILIINYFIYKKLINLRGRI